MSSVSGKILRGTFFISGANLLARIGTFLGNLIMIRLLGLEQLGELGLIESWLTVAMTIGLFGINVAVTKFVAEDLQKYPGRVGQSIANACLLTIFFSLLTAIILYIAIHYLLLPFTWWQQLQTTLSYYLLPFTLLLIISSFRTTTISIIHGLQEFPALLPVNFAIGLLSLPISYWLVSQYGLLGAINTRLLLTILETTFITYLLLRLLRARAIPLSVAQFGQNAKALLAIGIPTLTGQFLLNPVYSFVATFLAGQPNGLAQLGLITSANRLVGLTAFLPGSIAPTLIPILSAEWAMGNVARFSTATAQAIRLLWLATLPVIVFCMATSPALLTWLYGPTFQEAWPVAFLLFIVTFLGAINETNDRALIAVGRVWLSSANNLFWAVLFLAISFVAIPTHLAWGYGVALVISFTLYVGLQLGWLRYFYQLPLRPLVILLVFTLPMFGASWLIANQLTLVAQLVAAVLLVGLIGGLTWFGFISFAERAAVFQQLYRFRNRVKISC